MVDIHREELKKIRTFPSLIKYLRDDMGWPIESDDFEELTFEYTPEELGIDEKNSAKIESIKRLRPLVPHQPWGIFFVKFEPKKLPVVALRRILSKVVVKKRASSYQAEQVAWSADDLLFVSNYGESNERSISFAHFSQSGLSTDLPSHFPFSPSLNSTASSSPVDAPEGTAALPNAPLHVVTSTSTVGFPLESIICLAVTFSIHDIIKPPIIKFIVI